MRCLSLILVSCVSIITCYPQNIPVDPLTGRANISIPIWELSEGNLTVPIVVVYSGGGVRVAEGEGSAGMSWNLIAEGYVGRELRGLPDDYNVAGDSRKGWLINSNGSTINGFTPSGTACNNETADYNFINGFANVKDTEPDIFHFSAPGLSGSFVFGADGLPKTIPYQDLKFVIIRSDGGNGAIERIKIRNNVGIVYIFNLKETVKRTAFQSPASPPPVKYFTTDWYRYNTPLSYTSTWKLGSIVSPSGASIQFSYYPLDPAMSVRKVITINEMGKEYERYRVKEEIDNAYRLISISTNSIDANFDWDQNRISNVTIKDSQDNFEKGFNFVYDAIRDVNDTGTTLWRSFLKEIRRVEDCATLPSYEFTYEGIDFESHIGPIPFEDQNKQDYWGYYNSVAGSHVPTIYYYSGQTNAERFRLAPIPGQTPTQTLAGADRAVNTSAVIAGSLASIRYPTGSTATITSESNEFYDAVASQGSYGGGIRVKSVVITGVGKGSSNLQTDYEYKLASNNTSGKLVYRPVFAFAGGDSIYRSPDNLAPDGGVFYTRTTVKQTGKGKVVYDFIYPAVYPETSYSTDWAASLTRTARPTSCASIGNQETGYYKFPFAPNTNYDFEQGLSSRVTDYSESGTLVRQRSYSYQRLTTTAVPVKGLRYEMMPNGNYIYAQYTILANVNKVMITDTVRVADEITPANKIQTVTSYAYNTTHNMLESATSNNSDGITHKTKYKYVRDFSALTNPDTSKSAIAIKFLNDSLRHGEIVEVIKSRTEGGTELVTGASLTLYKDFGSSVVLPHTTMEFPPTSGFAATSITGSPQRLLIASGYRMTSIVRSYNPIGLPLSLVDHKKKKSGIHYGYFNTTPVATVVNAYAEQSAYSGFETVSSFNINVTSGTSSNVAGWTGATAKSITSSTVLRRDNVQKGIGKYRFSCWVKSSNTPTITFKAMNGVTVQSSATVVYSGAGQWQYREALLDMTSVNMSFSLEVVSSAAAELDDIRFYPAIASMATSTEKRLTGATSGSDDRGISSFKEYDELGRLRYVKDRNKNIVQVTDYRYRDEEPLPLTSNFTDDVNEPIQDDDIHFTAPVNCGGVTYAWEADNVQVGTSSSLIHAFPTAGYHIVELTVSTTAGTVTTTKSYCVEPDTGPIDLSTTGGTTIYKCDAADWRTSTAIGVKKCLGHTYDTPNSGFTWYFKPISSGVWIPITGMNPQDPFDTGQDADGDSDDESVTFSITHAGYTRQSYELKCTISPLCSIVNTPDERCNRTYDYKAEGTVSFIYVDNSPCQ